MFINVANITASLFYFILCSSPKVFQGVGIIIIIFFFSDADKDTETQVK